jgi:hypothetical protein
MFNTWTNYWLDCEHPTLLIPFCKLIPRTVGSWSIVLESRFCNLRLSLDRRRANTFHVSALFDEMLHSGMCDGTGKISRGKTGSCFSGLLTSTWSVRLCLIIFCCDFHFGLSASLPFSDSTLCRLWVASSMSGGLTMESSRLDHIAQHKASSNNLVTLVLA